MSKYTKFVETLAEQLNATITPLDEYDDSEFNQEFLITWGRKEKVKLTLDIRPKAEELYIVVNWPCDMGGRSYTPNESRYPNILDFLLWFPLRRPVELLADLIVNEFLPKVREEYLKQLKFANCANRIFKREIAAAEKASKLLNQYFGKNVKVDIGVWDHSNDTFAVQFRNLKQEKLEEILEAARRIIGQDEE